jgi:hypothetical protein
MEQVQQKVKIWRNNASKQQYEQATYAEGIREVLIYCFL